jgi:hypothetical protein
MDDRKTDDQMMVDHRDEMVFQMTDGQMTDDQMTDDLLAY